MDQEAFQFDLLNTTKRNMNNAVGQKTDAANLRL